MKIRFLASLDKPEDLATFVYTPAWWQLVQLRCVLPALPSRVGTPGPVGCSPHLSLCCRAWSLSLRAPPPALADRLLWREGSMQASRKRAAGLAPRLVGVPLQVSCPSGWTCPSDPSGERVCSMCWGGGASGRVDTEVRHQGPWKWFSKHEPPASESPGELVPNADRLRQNLGELR